MALARWIIRWLSRDRRSVNDDDERGKTTKETVRLEGETVVPVTVEVKASVWLAGKVCDENGSNSNVGGGPRRPRKGSRCCALGPRFGPQRRLQLDGRDGLYRANRIAPSGKRAPKIFGSRSRRRTYICAVLCDPDAGPGDCPGGACFGARVPGNCSGDCEYLSAFVCE